VGTNKGELSITRWAVIAPGRFQFYTDDAHPNREPPLDWVIEALAGEIESPLRYLPFNPREPSQVMHR
ncbi:MAG: hypothetical protein M3O70_20620, partial [Actinomycetota bacterium]|nr:hypothetical protein [Actinomycetota bacterium]